MAQLSLLDNIDIDVMKKFLDSWNSRQQEPGKYFDDFTSYFFEKTGLQISAQLENLEHVRPTGDDFRWYLKHWQYLLFHRGRILKNKNNPKLTCSSCGEETPEFVYCSLGESSPLTGGRGSASLVLKCKLCKRENSIDILKDSIRSYSQDDAGQFKTIVIFDCRGVSPSDFSPRVGWEAKCSESSTLFSDVDLKEMEWYEYDEQAKESVSITELNYKFVSVKH